MAIARDATAGGSTGTAVTSFSYNHTVGSGSARILWVTVDLYNGALMSGITYNSVSMTQAGTVQTNAGQLYLFYLANPSSGTNSVTISTTAGTGMSANSASYTGASSTGIPDGINSSAHFANGGTNTFTINTSADNCWGFLCGGGDRQGTAGTNATDITVDPNGSFMFDSNAAFTPAGLHSMAFSTTAGGFDGGIMVTFAPGSGVVATTSDGRRLNLLGVGN